MITDNLATLFGKDLPNVRFRQGTVLTWDPNTGANTIDVGGGTLTNVKCLTSGEAIALKAGHVITLLGQGSTWWIMGRIAGFGDPDFAGSSVAFDQDHASATNFGLTTTATALATATLDVPPWADEALVTVVGTVSVQNVNAGTSYYIVTQSFVEAEGGGGAGFGLSPLGDVSKNDLNCGTTGYSRRVTSLGSTISCSVQAWTTAGTLAASVSSTATVTASAVFRSTV